MRSIARGIGWSAYRGLSKRRGGVSIGFAASSYCRICVHGGRDRRTRGVAYPPVCNLFTVRRPGWFRGVERAADAEPTLVQHVGIDHGRFDAGMTEEFLRVGILMPSSIRTL
jgi:hypothetical protein